MRTYRKLWFHFSRVQQHWDICLRLFFQPERCLLRLFLEHGQFRPASLGLLTDTLMHGSNVIRVTITHDPRSTTGQLTAILSGFFHLVVFPRAIFGYGFYASVLIA